MHLLLAPALAGIVLVEAGEVAIVALVQRLVADGLRSGWPISSSMSSQVSCARDQGRGEGDVEVQAPRLQAAAGGARLLDARARSGRGPSSR